MKNSDILSDAINRVKYMAHAPTDDAAHDTPSVLTPEMIDFFDELAVDLPGLFSESNYAELNAAAADTEGEDDDNIGETDAHDQMDAIEQESVSLTNHCDVIHCINTSSHCDYVP